MDGITILTPTRDRVSTFKLCRKWVKRQTLKPAQWIIVDDGDDPIPENLREGSDYIRRERKVDDPEHTVRVNISTGLDFVKYEKVIIVEDDDWYHPQYLEQVAKALDNYELAGQGGAIYYHFPWKKWFDHQNRKNCSLCQTGFRKEIISWVKEIAKMSNNCFLDLDLWRNFHGKRFVLYGRPPLVIGMKGLPGKKCTVSGWDPKLYTNQDDNNYTFLRSFIGDDVEDYKKLIEENK